MVLLLGCPSESVRNDHGRLVPLTILHWNDFHSQDEPYKVVLPDTVTGRDTSYMVGGTATLLAYINQWKKPGNNVLVLNAGDEFQGAPISSLTFGQSQIELMNIIHPDAMELGNHEFDYGKRRLEQALALARYPVLCANVWDEEKNKFLVPPSLVLRKGNVKVGIVGFIIPALEEMVVRDSLAGIRMLSVDSMLSIKVREFRKDNVNLIIVLSHMGLEYDTVVARRHPDVDVIVGGHNHIPLFKPIKTNRTLVVQAGSQGRWLGKLDLVVDTKGDSVYSASERLVETRVSDVTPDAQASAMVESLVASQRKTMNEVIGELKTPWVRRSSGGTGESNIGDWEADAIRDYAHADVAFQNAGGIRIDLPAGAITVGDIWRMNPFGNHFVMFEVKGTVLRSMFEHVCSSNQRDVVHAGGARYVFDSSKPPGQKLVSVEVNGQALDDSGTYTIVTNNFIASNFKVHFGFEPQAIVFTSLPKLDREVFIDRIRSDKVVVSTIDGRVKDLHARK